MKLCMIELCTYGENTDWEKNDLGNLLKYTLWSFLFISFMLCIEQLALCELCVSRGIILCRPRIQSRNFVRNKHHAFRTQKITEPKYQAQCRLRLCTIAVSYSVCLLHRGRNWIYLVKILDTLESSIFCWSCIITTVLVKVIKELYFLAFLFKNHVEMLFNEIRTLWIDGYKLLFLSSAFL